jgi:homoserine kinase type II
MEAWASPSLSPGAPESSAPPAARRVADELLRRFGLGGALDVRVVAGGMLNQNLFATTARGRFFLKGYRYVDPAAVGREHALIAFVAARGVPAVAPLAGPSGESFLRVGGRLWAVFPALTDRQLPAQMLTTTLAAAMGRTLGRLHQVLSDLPPPEAARFPVRLLWDSAQAADEIAWYEVAIARLPALDPFDQHALSSFAYRRTLLRGGMPSPAGFAGLPTQVLHGDFHEGNLFFAGGDVSGIVDWELASVGPRAFEIIRTLDVALRLRDDLETGGERLRAFLHGYLAHTPLTYEECVAMPELYWAHRVHNLWVYEEHYRKGSARTDRVAMEDVAMMEWWVRNRQMIALTLADAARSSPYRGLSAGDDG